MRQGGMGPGRTSNRYDGSEHRNGCYGLEHAKGFLSIPAFSPKNLEIPGMRIAPQRLLHLQRQSVHAAPHVRVADREPHADAGRNRDHRASASITQRNASSSTSRSTRTRRPPPSSISIMPARFEVQPALALRLGDGTDAAPPRSPAARTAAPVARSERPCGIAGANGATARG